MLRGLGVRTFSFGRACEPIAIDARTDKIPFDAPNTSSTDHLDLEVRGVSDWIHGNTFFVSGYFQIDGTVADLKSPDSNLLQRFGKTWVKETDYFSDARMVRPRHDCKRRKMNPPTKLEESRLEDKVWAPFPRAWRTRKKALATAADPRRSMHPVGPSGSGKPALYAESERNPIR